MSVASLSNCTGVEQQAEMLFFVSEGVKTSQIYRRILTKYGEHSIAWKSFLCSMMKHTCILQQLLFKQSGS
jgi:hypothetical protein